MRIAYLAAGAGGMYCGSCLRDNRIAATLIAQGKSVVLIPLYTPLRTDETNVSQSQVLFGGINVYLQQRSAWLSLALRPFAKLLDRPGVLRAAMALSGGTNPKDLGPLTVFVLRATDRSLRREVKKLIDGLRASRPDVVILPNLMFTGVAAAIREALQVPILCTLSGEDVFLDELREPFRSEAFGLVADASREINGFVATSNYYAKHAQEHFGLPPDRIHVVPMGVRVEDFHGSENRQDRPFVFGYLARVCPEKGLAKLAEAFVELRREGRECLLRVAGYLGPQDRAYLADVQSLLRESGFDRDFDYAGEVTLEQKATFLAGLHTLCVPTVYHEAKGFYVLEAMASGVPVVQPGHGSFPEIIEASGGGLLYDPDDPEGLPKSLAQMMDQPELRARLGRAGREYVQATCTSERMAEAFWKVCEEVVGKNEIQRNL